MTEVDSADLDRELDIGHMVGDEDFLRPKASPFRNHAQRRNFMELGNDGLSSDFEQGFGNPFSNVEEAELPRHLEASDRLTNSHMMQGINALHTSQNFE